MSFLFKLRSNRKDGSRIAPVPAQVPADENLAGGYRSARADVVASLKSPSSSRSRFSPFPRRRNAPPAALLQSDQPDHLAEPLTPRPTTPTFSSRLELDFVRSGDVTPAERPDSVYFDGTEVEVAPNPLRASIRPGTFRGDPTIQTAQTQSDILTLYAIFLVTTSPKELYSSLPCTSNYLPSPAFASDDHDWKEDFATAAGWVRDPEVLESLLRRSLRSIAWPIRQSMGSDHDGLPPWYDEFCREEERAGYPSDAISRILSPLIPEDTARLLEAVFDVCECLISKSGENGSNESYLCGIFGWWSLGCSWKTMGSKREETEWERFVGSWGMASRAFSHLLRARVRERAQRESTSERLLPLVDEYRQLPWEQIDAESAQAKVRWIKLRRIAAAPAEIRYTPQALSSVAVSHAGKWDTEIPEWIRREGLGYAREDSSVDTLNGGERDHSASRSLSTPGLANITTPSSATSPYTLRTPMSVDGTMSGRVVHDPAERYRVLTYGAEGFGTTEPSAVLDWQDFSKIGFDGTDTIALSKPFDIGSIVSARDPLRAEGGLAQAESSPVAQGHQVAPESQLSTLGPRGRKSLLPGDNNEWLGDSDDADANWFMISMEWTHLPESLVNFLEDAAHDTIATSDWPNFALIRRRGQAIEGGARERVLVTVEDEVPEVSVSSVSSARGDTPGVALEAFPEAPPTLPHKCSDRPDTTRPVKPHGEVTRTNDQESVPSIQTASIATQHSLSATLKRGRRKSLSLFRAMTSFGTLDGKGSVKDLQLGSSSEVARSSNGDADFSPGMNFTAGGTSDRAVQNSLGTDGAEPDRSAARPFLRATGEPGAFPSDLNTSSHGSTTRPNRAHSGASYSSITRKPVPPLLAFEGDEGRLSVNVARKGHVGEDRSGERWHTDLPAGQNPLGSMSGNEGGKGQLPERSEDVARTDQLGSTPFPVSPVVVSSTPDGPPSGEESEERSSAASEQGVEDGHRLDRDRRSMAPSPTSEVPFLIRSPVEDDSVTPDLVLEAETAPCSPKSVSGDDDDDPAGLVDPPVRQDAFGIALGPEVSLL